MYEIVYVFIERDGAPIAGAQILQKLNSGAGGRSQGGDTKMRAEDVVQVFLFCPIVFAFARDAQTEKVAIELEARVGVGNGDCGMVNPQEDAITWAMPLGIALPLGKPKDFDRVLIRILEVEGLDATCVLVPIREALRR